MTAETLASAGLLHAAAAKGLAVAALVSSRICRNPHVGRVLWLAVLVKLLVPPVWWVPVTAPVPVAVEAPAPPSPERQRAGPSRPTPPRNPREDRSSEFSPPAPHLPPAPTPAGPAPKVGPPRPEPARSDRQAVPAETPVFPFAWLLAAWAAGALVVWTVGLTRAVRFGRAVRRLPAGNERLTRLLSATADRLGAPAPDLRVSRRTGPLLFAGPVTRLFGRPAVVVPGPLFEALSDDAARSLLAHELAHLARGDHRVRWLELLVCGAWWWLPTAWLAAAAGRRAEEACCDAAAVRALADPNCDAPDPSPYAAALLAAAEFLSRPPAGGSVPVPRTASPAGPRALQRRFTMLLSAPPPVRPGRSARLALLSVCASALLAGVTIGQDDPPPDPAPTDPVAGESADPPAVEEGPVRPTPGAVPPAASNEPQTESVHDELTGPGESATSDEPGDATADESIRLEPGVKREVTFAVDETITLFLPEGRTVDGFFESPKFLDVELPGPDGAVRLRSRTFGRDTFTVIDRTEQNYSVAITVPPPAEPRTLEELVEVANAMFEPSNKWAVPLKAPEVARVVIGAATDSDAAPAAREALDMIADGTPFPAGAEAKQELRVQVRSADSPLVNVFRRVVLTVPREGPSWEFASDWEVVTRRPATAAELAAAARDRVAAAANVDEEEEEETTAPPAADVEAEEDVPVPLDTLVARFNEKQNIAPPLTVEEVREAAAVRLEVEEWTGEPEDSRIAAVAAGEPVPAGLELFAANGDLLWMVTDRRTQLFLIRDGDGISRRTWWRVQKTLLAGLEDPGIPADQRLRLLEDAFKKGLAPAGAVEELFDKLGPLGETEDVGTDAAADAARQAVVTLDHLKMTAPDAAAIRRLAAMTGGGDDQTMESLQAVYSILSRTVAEPAGLRRTLDLLRSDAADALSEDQRRTLVSTVARIEVDDEETARMLLEAAESGAADVRRAALAALSSKS